VAKFMLVVFKEVDVLLLNKKLIGCLCLLLISSCGGGGSSSGGSTNNSSDSPIKIAKTELAMEALADEGKRYSSTVRVDLSSDIKSKLSSGKTLYFVLSQTNDNIASLSAEVFSNYGNLIVNTYVLPQGSYQSKITVKGCYDSNCNDEFGKVTLDLNFIVHEKLNYPDEAFEITHYIDTSNDITELQVDLKTLVLLDSQWEYEIVYNDKATDWLVAEKRTENNQAIISLLGNELACGLYESKVIIKYTTASGLFSQFSVPIKYTVSSTTPIASSVFPKVHYANKAMQFTLKGCGIENLTLENANFANLNVTTINKRNDSEVELITEGINTLGEVSAGFAEQAVIADGALLQISSLVEYPQQEIDLLASESLESKHSQYDQFNNRLYFNNIDGWHAYYWHNNQWQAAPNFISDGINDLEISNDGKQIFIIKDQNLETRDSLTYALINDMALEQLSYGAFSSVRSLSSSELLLGQYSEGNLGRLMRYDVLNNNLYEMPVHSVSKFASGTITTSADRSFALLPLKSSSSGIASYHLFENANETIERVLYSTQDADMYRFSMSQNAKRMLTVKLYNNYVYDLPAGRFSKIPSSIKVGEFSTTAFFKDAVISKDGNKVFALYMKSTNNMLHIRTFDISGLAEGNGAIMTEQVIDFLGYAGFHPQLQLDDSESTAFIFDRKLVVIPLTK